MNTRSSTRSSSSSNNNVAQQAVDTTDSYVSEAEGMDENEEEAEENETDNDLFVPRPSTQTLNRIRDTEEIADNGENSELTDISEEDDSDNHLHRLFERRTRYRHRYRRIYFPDTEELLSEEEEEGISEEFPDARFSSSDEGGQPVLNRSYVEESDSTEEGRGSPDNDVSMRDEDSDSDVIVLPNEEEMSRESAQSVHSDPSTVTVNVDACPASSNLNGGVAVTESAQCADTTASSTIKLSNKAGPSTSAPSSAPADLEDDSQTCPICFETWSSAGEHRIVSLKCGHLFGKKCIERWLKGQGGKCPHCNAKATKKDIRVIYARCLKAEDTTERVRLAQEIEKLKKEKVQFEKEQAQLKMKNAVDSQLIKDLQQQLFMLKESVGCSSSRGLGLAESGNNARTPRTYKLAMFRAFDLANKSGSCRVMAFNEWMNMLVVSMQSQVDLFPGFGVKKLNSLDLKVESYVPLHSKQIRDLQFNPNKRDLLLSVGIDKVAKITNIASNSTVASYTTKHPLWCCCWNSSKSCEFFAGTSAGSIYHFDTVQNTNEPITTYQISGSGPVVSISYVPLDHTRDFHLAGLIVTRLTSVSFLELLESGIKEHNLPIEGSFSHTAFDPFLRHLLATCRPTDRNPHARHILCELKVINVSDDPATISNVVSVHQLFSFQGSTTMKVLSRACLTSSGLSTTQNESNPVVMFSEESTSSFKLYDASTASQTQTIKTSAHVIDILLIQGSEGRYVATLSEKSLILYKWIEQLARKQ